MTDPIRYFEHQLQEIEKERARVQQFLKRCERWPDAHDDIVSVVLFGPASVPGFQKRLQRLEQDKRRAWRKEAALLAAHQGMDDSFVSGLTGDELQLIHEHKGSPQLRSLLHLLERRVGIGQLEALRARYQKALRQLNAAIETMSLREDSEDQVLNLRHGRERVEADLAEVERQLRVEEEKRGTEPAT